MRSFNQCGRRGLGTLALIVPVCLSVSVCQSDFLQPAAISSLYVRLLPTSLFLCRSHTFTHMYCRTAIRYAVPPSQWSLVWEGDSPDAGTQSTPCDRPVLFQRDQEGEF